MNNLSWECHINEISKNIASRISAIKRIRYFLPLRFYLTLTIHWYSHSLTTVIQYEEIVLRTCLLICKKLKNRTARVLTFSNYDRSTSELFQNLKWLTLAHQHVVSKAIMMHSIVNNTAPEYLTLRFGRRCDLTRYNLRTSGLTTRSLKTRDSYIQA